MFGLDSIVKSAIGIGSTALLGPAGPIVSSILGNAVSGGGSDPLQSLLGAIADPFKAIFPQAQNVFPLPFRQTPSAFQGPVVSGSAGDLLKSFGNLDSQEASALQLLQSDKFGDQVAGKQQLDKINRAKELVLQLLAADNELKKKLIGNIS